MNNAGGLMEATATHTIANVGKGTYPVNAGPGPSTVSEVLAAGGLSPGNREVLVGGATAAPGDIVPRGEELTVTERVSGG
ncbi:MAG: hypothetical protein HYZ09_01130 [Candidatus Kerfeldbacteria bacterium]|nr:hypothetical protein [Candidatus Kerfeldbacteria bacterium]